MADTAMQFSNPVTERVQQDKIISLPLWVQRKRAFFHMKNIQRHGSPACVTCVPCLPTCCLHAEELSPVDELPSDELVSRLKDFDQQLEGASASDSLVLRALFWDA